MFFSSKSGKKKEITFIIVYVIGGWHLTVEQINRESISQAWIHSATGFFQKVIKPLYLKNREKQFSH